jgi:hypothetical protein
MSRCLWCAVAAVCCVTSGPVFAQGDRPDYSAPAHIAVVQGAVTLERNGVAEPAVENMPLLQGDRLETDAGRVEIVLPDGSVLDLDRHTTVDLLDGGLLRLPGGRVIFVVARPEGGSDARRDYQVDAPAGSVRFSGAGEYRASTQASSGLPFLEVSVVRGEAVIDAEGRSVAIRPGERAQVTQGQGVTAVGTFNSAVTDAFTEWADNLRGERVGSQSNAYLPSELQVYGGTFDRDGSWDNSGEYGWVWYPQVAADWRPYYDGGWYPYGWGWTWVGAGRWAWPTHHYGRWGHGAHGWFWIPAAQWGPAWVSWGFGGDYVSWCPLDYHDTPGFGLSFGFSVGGVNARLGWTVVPQHAFGHGYRVAPFAVRGQQLRAVEQVNFAVRRAGPPVPGGAATQRFGNGRATPYDRAQAAAEQRVGSNPGWARATPGSRPVATVRGTPMATPAAAGPRTRSTASAAERAGSYDTRAFSSAPQAGSPYPDRYRSGGTGTSSSSLGSAVPRSAPSRPSESRSPYYYLGPSDRTQQPLPSAPAPASDRPAPGQRGGQGDPHSDRSSTGAAPAPAQRWTGEPRTYPGSQPYSSPSTEAASPDLRTYSAPDRSAQPRPDAPEWSAPSSGVSSRSAAGPSAKPAGRTPGYSPGGGGVSSAGVRSSGGAAPSGARQAGGGASSGTRQTGGGSPSGGRPAGGGGGRGGRGR